MGRRRAAILALFLLSGASGLIYQVVWFRLLATVFGATVPAATTVLAAFMSGLALGSYLLGGAGDRTRQPLRLYAGYELGIAAAALAALVAMERMRPVAILLSSVLGDGGAGLAAARFVVAFLVMHLPRRVYESVLHTFATSFPHASLWVLPDRDTFLVGSRQPLAPDWALVSARLQADPAGGAASNPFAGQRKHGVTTPAAAAAMYVAGREALLDATAHAPINSLERPHVEFCAFADYTKSINGMIAGNYELLLALRSTAEVPARAETSHRALSLYLQALGRAYALQQDSAAIDELLAEALSLAPESALLRSAALSYYATRVTGRLRAGDPAQARRYLAAAHRTDGGAEVYRLAALLRLHEGDTAGALRELLEAVQLAPRDVALHTSLFRLLWQNGAVDEAARHLQAVLEVAPDSVFANRNLGLYLARRRGAAAAALPYLERAHARTPRDAELIGALAWAYAETGDRAGARAVVRSGGRYFRSRPELAAERTRILDS